MVEDLPETSSAPSRLSLVTRKVKVVEDLRRIEEAHLIHMRWRETGPEYEAAFQALCRYKQELLQVDIAKQVQHVILIEKLFERIATRRTETKKLAKVKERQQAKVRQAAQHWYECRSAGSHDLRRQKLPADLESEIMRGIFPWHSSEEQGESAYAHPLSLGTRLTTDLHNITSTYTMRMFIGSSETTPRFDACRSLKAFLRHWCPSCSFS